MRFVGGGRGNIKLNFEWVLGSHSGSYLMIGGEWRSDVMEMISCRVVL